MLARIADAERRDREVQREKLQLAYQWCVQHPDDGRVGSLGGKGTPGVAPFVAEELGAAVGVSTQSAMSLMADALDLRHRLPQLWARVEAGELAPYKTRRLTTDTRPLPYEAARWVDESSRPGSTGSGRRPSSVW